MILFENETSYECNMMHHMWDLELTRNVNGIRLFRSSKFLACGAELMLKASACLHVTMETLRSSIEVMKKRQHRPTLLHEEVFLKNEISKYSVIVN